MSNFEKITASLETLGDFLASLKAADTPWEDAFHKTFCTECGRDNCDEKPCPFQKERDNPTWWLFQTADGEQEAAKDSEREFLIREYERSKLDRIVRLPDGKQANCGTCVCFSAWMNGKGPDGKALRSVEKVILPTVTEYVRNGYRDCPMGWGSDASWRYAPLFKIGIARMQSGKSMVIATLWNASLRRSNRHRSQCTAGQS